MPSTYSNLKVQLMATGENTGTWGNVTNDNLGTALEQAIVETATVTFASANVTLTLTDTNAKQDARALRLNLAGTTGGARDLIVPAIQKPYIVNNGTADIITVKVSGQTGVAVPASTSMLLYNNGTDVVVAFNRVVGNVVGNLTGTASNATVLQTARNIQISGNVTAANVSFDGSAAVNLDVTAINAAGITSGTLGVARGGTGATTLNSEAVIIGNTTGAVKFVAPGTSGNVLTSNGTAWVSQAAAAGGGNYVMQVYNSPATWTKPASIKAVKVTVVGGGGGGAGATSPTPGPARQQGPGGGGGGVAMRYIDAPAIPGPVSVTVGGGGAVRTSGGASSFGPFASANGGSAGTPAPSSTLANLNIAQASGGSGTAPTGWTMDGQPSDRTISDAESNSNPTRFTGGASLFGFAPYGRYVQGPPPTALLPAVGYGSGGMGNYEANGTAGTAGFVIVEEFY